MGALNASPRLVPMTNRLMLSILNLIDVYFIVNLCFFFFPFSSENNTLVVASCNK